MQKTIEEPKLEPLLISPAQLSESALLGLVKEFILREGTDYGIKEHSLDEKIQHIMKQLSSGKIRIVFDSNDETTTIITQF